MLRWACQPICDTAGEGNVIRDDSPDAPDSQLPLVLKRPKFPSSILWDYYSQCAWSRLKRKDNR
jgi:hypothetical protein